jgi:hypothetical protein
LGERRFQNKDFRAEPSMTGDATNSAPIDRARRDLLTGVASCAAIGTLLVLSSRVRAADAGGSKLPLLEESDPAAQATQYVGDAHHAKTAAAGANCSNCSLYGSINAGSGTCSIFPKNRVAAAGWCNAWSSL